MITIELESEGENRRGRLTTTKSPYRRRLFLVVSIVSVALANYYVFFLDVDLAEKLTRLLVLTCAIPFVVWFIFSARYTSTLGSTLETRHIVTGKNISFEYSLSADEVVEKSKYGERKYPYSDFIRHEKLTQENEQILIFKNGLIYLPQYAVKQGNIEEFTAKLEQQLATIST